MPDFFSKKLLEWHAKNPRQLPWEGGPRDPYHIWISEVIMQQTRIEQGASYYLRFVNRFPDVFQLAAASLDEVLRYWQGLGYYTRARNLHKAAKFIVTEHNGVFPNTYDQLIRLPGVGPYSASAIASFAYNLPYPVVDGNVKRVVARFEGIHESINLPSVHEMIRKHTVAYMRSVDPATFNQAIMNFGALICKPQNPLCDQCPLKSRCVAYISDLTSVIPVSNRKTPPTERHFHFLVLHYGKKILLQQRSGKDIWHSLYTPPVLETTNERKPISSRVRKQIMELVGHDDFEFTISSDKMRQLLSHQIIHGKFHHVTLNYAPKTKLPGYTWVTKKEWENFGKPKMIVDYFRDSTSL